jgi:hypothetical protein
VKWVADAINESMKDEIQWPDENRRTQLAQRLPEFPGCIGHVEGTLVAKIDRQILDRITGGTSMAESIFTALTIRSSSTTMVCLYS